MSISQKEVEEVAKLARLSLTEQEKELFAAQLSEIIEAFRELSEIDTNGVEPMSHALSLVNVLREDEVKASLSRETLMANAPSVENGFFRVPKISE